MIQRPRDLAARDEVDRLLARLRPLISDLAAVDPSSVSQHVTAQETGDYSEIIDKAKNLRDAMSAMGGRKPSVSLGGRDALLANYIREVGLNWRSVYKRPPVSANGPYAAILTAGWSDLQWPGWEREFELAELIGRGIVKHAKPILRAKSTD